MPLAALVDSIGREAAQPSADETLVGRVGAALATAYAWTGSPRHAVPARDLYACAAAALGGRRDGRHLVAAVRVAVARLGGWFVLRGNYRHVRGAKPAGMDDVAAWEWSARGLRKPWRRAA